MDRLRARIVYNIETNPAKILTDAHGVVLALLALVSVAGAWSVEVIGGLVAIDAAVFKLLQAFVVSPRADAAALDVFADIEQDVRADWDD